MIMLGFLTIAFEKMLGIIAWLVIIGSAIFGGMVGYSFGGYNGNIVLLFICGILGIIVGFILDVLTFGLMGQIIEIKYILRELDGRNKEKKENYYNTSTSPQNIVTESVDTNGNIVKYWICKKCGCSTNPLSSTTCKDCGEYS